MKVWRIRLPTHALFVTLFACMTGCVSLKAVTDYAETTTSTLDSVGAIAEDFVHSCHRINAYKEMTALIDINDKSACQAERKAADGVFTLAKALNLYTEQLGKFAAGDADSTKNEYAALVKELSVLSTLDEEKAKSLASLAETLTDLSTRTYRQNHLAEYIKNADPAITAIVNNLADLLSTNYVNQIAIENVAWGAEYLELQNLKSKNDLTRLLWPSYAKNAQQTRADLVAKLKATTALIDKIKGIGTTHKALKVDAANLSSLEVLNAVNTFTKEVKPVIKNVRESFTNK